MIRCYLCPPPGALRLVCVVSMRPGLKNTVTVLNNASGRLMDNLEQSCDSVLHHGRKERITQSLPLGSIDIPLPAGHRLH